MKSIKSMTEAELREHKVPTFNTIKELNAYVSSLLKRPHDYGTAVYAVSCASTAMFNYMARKQGISGFQASCADMDIIRRTRLIKGPFMLLDLHDHMYPQYDLRERVDKAIKDNAQWFKSCAIEYLKTKDPCDEVKEHWENLAAVDIKGNK